MHKPQLFMLHYAGGSIYSFNFLKKYLELELEVIYLELPGRGKRMGERLITDKDQAIQDQLRCIEKYRNKEVPYVLYGHSMGATLAFEAAKILEIKEDSPQRLIVSGNAGPGVNRDEIRYNAEPKEFKLVLKELGGISKDVFENEELFEFFEPILRADFEIVERGEVNLSQRINCPIHCVMGSNEKFVHRIENWREYTASTFHSEIFEGNHFFINAHPEKLSTLIKKAFHGALAL